MEKTQQPKLWSISLDTEFTNPTPKIYYLYYQWITKVCRNREGYEPQLAAVATGSHIDAIPYSGKYNGVVGVLGAIQVINVLKRFASGLTVAKHV
ncbi:Ureidoglycolate hydrolase [Camellia lanceoleosa]|uniref:Ureidoglycolate hydrolase n=1 Tax=Camellia lanceoleosa TaxID=1840588 RepID=A0ACC0GRD3_9ERIC|nr:Ureidoglycolate hydrolase [Camellia lanceoleosa]